jgi:hypothetical protein
MFSILASGEDVIVHHNELPMDPLLYGVVAMVAFVALAFVVWSYRDVSNRHSHKVDHSSGHH